MIMRFLSLLILLILAVGKVIAQSDFRPGYVITHSKDTLQGLIDYRGEIRNMKVCTYKESNDHVPKEFLPQDIYGYRFDTGKFFISKHIHNKNFNDTVFVEFLLKGISNLYFFKSTSYTAYFIEPEDGDLVELRSEDIEFTKDDNSNKVYIRKDRTYIGLLNYTFSDYPELQKQIANTELSHKGLLQITRKYHEYKCDDESCIIYEKKLPVLKILLLPYIGYSVDFYRTKGSSLEKFDFDASHSLVGGLELNFIIPRVNEKLSIFTICQIKQQQFQGHYHQPSVYNENNFVADIQNTSVLLAGGLKYTYPKGTFKPTMGIGLYKDWSANGEAMITETATTNSGEIRSSKTDIDGVNTSKLGMVFTIGGLVILKKATPFFNVSFFTGKGKYRYVSSPVSPTNEFTKSLQVAIGVMF